MSISVGKIYYPFHDGSAPMWSLENLVSSWCPRKWTTVSLVSVFAPDMVMINSSSSNISLGQGNFILLSSLLTTMLVNIITLFIVQSLSLVWLSVAPWTAACQPSLSITKSMSLLRLMPIESVMPYNHLIFCLPLLLLPSIFPIIRGISNESVLHIGGQSIGASASASVLPMNIQEAQWKVAKYDMDGNGWLGKETDSHTMDCLVSDF